RKQKPHSFLDLLFGYFDHTGETVAEDLPVLVPNPYDTRPVGKGRGLGRLSDDVSRSQGFGGIVCQGGLSGEYLRFLTTFNHRLHEAGRDATASNGCDDHIEVEIKCE